MNIGMRIGKSICGGNAEIGQLAISMLLKENAKITTHHNDDDETTTPQN